MQVYIDGLSNVEMKVKKKGVAMKVYDNNQDFVGSIYITQSKIIWCEGKIRRENGREVSWDQFREYMNVR